jgi:hypothetical protein
VDAVEGDAGEGEFVEMCKDDVEEMCVLERLLCRIVPLEVLK